MAIGYSSGELSSLQPAPYVAGLHTTRPPAFLVTVDAECDNAWDGRKDVTTVNAGFLSRFQTLCESYQLRPTYFTTFEMALSPAYQEFGRDILKRGTGEIGMHLHAWDSPPIVPLTDDDTLHHPYLTEYPESVMREKIACITGLLEETFDSPITSHRAGRWGFNETYARLLVEKRYVADCSVTPLNSWASHLGDPRRNGGPDYSAFPLLPYFVDLLDISRPGTSPLLEIPVTAMELHSRLLRAIRRPWSKRSLAFRAVNRAFPPRCLLAPAKGNIGLMLRVVKKSLEMGRPCVQFALHSSNLMPGCSPPFPLARDVEELYEDMHKLFALAHSHFRGATVTQFCREFSEACSVLTA